MSRMGIPPTSAGTSSGEWSLGGGGRPYHRRNSTPKSTIGGRSIMTAGNASLSTIQIRPMTGLARVDNQIQNGTNAPGSTPMRLVESVGYYQSMIQSKIDDIVREIDHLRAETQKEDSESDERRAIEKRHGDLSKAVQKLEGDLADFNLAKEYARSGAHPDDVKNEALLIMRNNKKMENEIDQIFFKRKKAEDEVLRVESELKSLHAAIECKLLESGGDIDHYKSLVKEIETVIAETKQQEDDILLMRHKLRTMKNDPVDSQYKEEKMRVDNLKKRLEQVESDIQLAHMTEDEAREHLLGKICDIRLRTKELEEESTKMESKLQILQEVQIELRSELRMNSAGGSASAYDRLLKRDAKVKRNLEELPKRKDKLEREREDLLSSIETLRNDINERKKMSGLELPTKEEMELMKDEVVFTGKQLDANQETMALLQQQKKTRVEELEQIDTLEERIAAEMKELEKRTDDLSKDIEKYSNLSDLQDAADASKEHFVEMSDKYTQGIALLDKLLKGDDVENSLVWKEVQELKSKIRSQRKEFFESQESAQLRLAKAEYGDIKNDCLRLISKINKDNISRSQ